MSTLNSLAQASSDPLVEAEVMPYISIRRIYRFRFHPPSPFERAMSLAVRRCERLIVRFRNSQDQMSTLEKMIEFYSNKNNLTANEKQIVRTIISQHIRNQSLPLPAPDASVVCRYL